MKHPHGKIFGMIVVILGGLQLAWGIYATSSAWLSGLNKEAMDIGGIATGGAFLCLLGGFIIGIGLRLRGMQND